MRLTFFIFTTKLTLSEKFSDDLTEIFQNNSPFKTHLYSCFWTWTPGWTIVQWSIYKPTGSWSNLARNTWKVFTAWKVSVFGVILVRIFSHSDWIWRDTPSSVRMWENADQNNYEYGHFLRSDLNQFFYFSFFYKEVQLVSNR